MKKNKLRKEVFEAEDVVKESFESLKKELNSKIKSIMKDKATGKINPEDEATITKLKKSIDYLEKLMKKELDDIKKEVNK